VIQVVVPRWATEIVKEVCLENKCEVAKLIWRMKKGGGFSTIGYYKKYKEGLITISVGRDNLEKQVLLHELSHHLDKEGGHGRQFYSILKELLVKYDCLTEDYIKRENNYRKASLEYLLMKLG
jgi:hypothetical protein